MSGAAVVYLRVSTEDQAESGLGLSAQEEACRALAGRAGRAVASIWRDEGVSGSRPLDRRPGLMGAIGALARGDWLVVAKRDRLFRTDDFDRAVILRAVASRGARIASAAGEGSDDDSPAGDLMAGILDHFARYERQIGIHRTTAALRAKRSRGERCGQVPYGWRLGADGRTIEPDPADVGLVEAARRLRSEGRSLRAVADELVRLGFRPKRGGGGFGASTVRRLLAGGEDGTCPAI